MSSEHQAWFERIRGSSAYQALTQRPIAYFCAEFALTDALPTYAGGLGVLAGDYIAEAADQQIPLVGIGLYYREGFTRKELSKEGKVVEAHTSLKPEDANLQRVCAQTGEHLKVHVPIRDTVVHLCAWAHKRGSTTIYLLDSDLEENEHSDRHITSQLYVSDKETRFKQEMILGIGGFRLLGALGIQPSVYHLNEGHSALLAFELIRHEMHKHNLSFEQALENARKNILFTNHTLVAAGNDVFSNDLVALLLGKYAEELQIPVSTLVDLGLVQESSTFSMTMLALRTAGTINAVSKLHAKKAAEIWTDHPTIPITNGIHIATWDRMSDTEHMWEKHQHNKAALLEVIYRETGQIWDKNTILLGWARRMVQYKRPLALVERLKRFNELARNPARPIHVVFAGLAHPSDEDGIHLLEELQYRLSSDLKGIAVFLPNYNLKLSSLLTAGCDVWMNTPVVGFEACGTSGMKAALNGSLPLTTRDGWVDEIDLYDIGWQLQDSNITDDILDKLEKEILPLYYTRNEENIPEPWVKMMAHARELIQNQFSMTRVLREYLEQGLHVRG